MTKQHFILVNLVLTSGLFLTFGLISPNARGRDWGTDPIFIPRGHYETYYDTTERDKVLEHLDNCIHQNNICIVKLRASVTGLESEITTNKLSMYKLYKERDALQETLQETLPQYLSLKNLEATLKKNNASLASLKDLIQSAQKTPLDEDIRDFIRRYLDSDNERRHSLAQELSALIKTESNDKKRTLLNSIRDAIQSPTESKSLKKGIVEQSFDELRVLSKNHHESLAEIFFAVNEIAKESETNIVNVQNQIKEIVSKNSQTDFDRIDALTFEIAEMHRKSQHIQDQVVAMKSEISDLEKNNSVLEPQKSTAPSSVKKRRWVKPDYSILP